MKSLKDKIVVAAIIAGVFSFIILTGTVSSGFHFTDDHEIVKMNRQLMSSSVFELSKEWTSWDMKSNARFRPFYYIHRVIEARLFGDNFVLWSLYHAAIFCGAVLLFYFGMRKLHFTITISLLMVVITFIGPQISVLWLLGPGESLAMLLLGGSFFMAAKGSVKKNLNYDILFIIFLALASLTKESFLLAVPGMIFLKIWIEKDHLYTSFRESAARNLLLIIPLAFMMIELAIIKFYVGTGYAGLSKSLYETAGRILITSLSFGKDYFNLLIAVSALLIAGIIFRIRVRIFSMASFLFLILIILPNVILYSNYGLNERYLLPSTFGLGFFIASWINTIDLNRAWFRMAALILFLPFIPVITDTYVAAESFAIEGKNTNELLNSLSENFKAEKPVLVVADPVRHYEMSASLMTYLRFEKDLVLYGFPVVADSIAAVDSDYIEGWKGYFYRMQLEDMKSVPGLIIFLDRNLTDKFFHHSGLKQDDFVPIDSRNSSPFKILKNKY